MTQIRKPFCHPDDADSSDRNLNLHAVSELSFHYLSSGYETKAINKGPFGTVFETKDKKGHVNRFLVFARGSYVKNAEKGKGITLDGHFIDSKSKDKTIIKSMMRQAYEKYEIDYVAISAIRPNGSIIYIVPTEIIEEEMQRLDKVGFIGANQLRKKLYHHNGKPQSPSNLSVRMNQPCFKKAIKSKSKPRVVYPFYLNWLENNSIEVIRGGTAPKNIEIQKLLPLCYP